MIDFGSGNLQSAVKSFEHLGAEATLTSSPADLAGADALVLPGQGAFGDGMAGLESRGLIEPLRDQVQAGKPLLGICIGLQLFFESSEEAPGVSGLGFLKGTVAAFKGDLFGAQGKGPQRLKVPQMGWNVLKPKGGHPVFADLGQANETYVYFVHSYYVCPSDEDDVLAWSEYGGPFCAAAGRGQIVGCQFHPEKSQRVGLKILANFLDWIGN